jgi:hypothetical protein
MLLAGLAAGAVCADDWSPVRKVDGITVEARSTASGFDEHRGSARVCTQLPELETLVADTDRFSEWLPYTRDAQLLEASETQFIYYVRSSTPWPMKDRDMVYRVTRQPDSDEGLSLQLVGLPDYEPAHEGATRIREASGQWRFTQTEDGLMVTYQLFVDPGPVPAFMANGRLASAVGKTLANLANRYPCAQT